MMVAALTLFGGCSGGGPLANPELFVKPAMDPPVADLAFRQESHLRIDGEDLLVTDPIYLADVYNAKNDECAAYIRANGVILHDFGGDAACPIWWKPPHLVLPISLSSPPQPPANTTVLAKEVGCDSGSFVFLPIRIDMPVALVQKVGEVVEAHNGALLELPSGRYDFYYEQCPVPPNGYFRFYRNIVVVAQ